MALLPEQQDYGLDLSCIEDLDPAMVQVSGRQLLAEALARRLQTARGTLIDDPNYGYDVTALLNDDVDTKTIAQIAGKIDAEFKKDQRVLSSQTTVTYSNFALLITSSIRDAVGPFPLVLAASAVTVKILQVGQ